MHIPVADVSHSTTSDFKEAGSCRFRAGWLVVKDHHNNSIGSHQRLLGNGIWCEVCTERSLAAEKKVVRSGRKTNINV